MTDNTLRILLRMLDEIEAIHALLDEHGSGASSIEIEDLVGKAPKITTKNYPGSEVPIDAAIADHARAKQLADTAWRNDWALSVEALRGSR